MKRFWRFAAGPWVDGSIPPPIDALRLRRPGTYGGNSGDGDGVGVGVCVWICVGVDFAFGVVFRVALTVFFFGVTFLGVTFFGFTVALFGAGRYGGDSNNDDDDDGDLSYWRW